MIFLNIQRMVIIIKRQNAYYRVGTEVLSRFQVSTLSDPTSNLVRQYDFPCSAPMSEDVGHGFCCVCSPAVGTCLSLFFI
jgi:hypothetical protein